MLDKAVHRISAATRPYGTLRSARSWGPGNLSETYGIFTPRLDVTEDARTFTVTAELPGMSEKDIDLSLSGDTLIVRGEKKDEKEEKGRNYYFSERSYGSFSRTIKLPEGIESEKIEARFKNGVLTVKVPKSAKAVEEKKTIKIAS